MRLHRTKKGEVDALDLAAIWPCGPAAGIFVPPIELSRMPRPARPDEVNCDENL